MKKIIFIFVGILALFASSCDDMISVESARELETPEIDSKTDSLFYVLGILEAMQEACEMYVIQNELRGDVADVTTSTNTNLQALANFSADTSNKYDSAYVYYKVINNCNYYIAYRDTALYNGSVNVTLTEYAAVLAFRAWAYLQLCRTYGKVKYYDEPLTSLSQIEDSEYPTIGLSSIILHLEDQLLEFSSTAMPYAGSTNTYGSGSTVYLDRCMIPINVVLGEMYLEAGQYEDAAQCYFNFLNTYGVLAQDWRSAFDNSSVTQPTDYTKDNTSTWFSDCCQTISSDINTGDIITYIPFAETSLEGFTTMIPYYFGYNYYYKQAMGSSADDDSVYLDAIQIVPSDSYQAIADSATYYYQGNDNSVEDRMRSIEGAGDMRAKARIETHTRDNVGTEYQKLYQSINVILYRGTTVWLHLAEALNRMGYPDAAFAILKDGYTNTILNYSYLKDETKTLLTTTFPFLSESGSSSASLLTASGSSTNYGIHRHGCSDQYGLSYENSLYNYSDIVGERLAEIGAEWGLELTDSTTNTLQDTINAVEDLLCDEYAMEFAFEGTRFADIARLARHKNGNGSSTYTGTPDKYGTNFGGEWFAAKLAFKNPVVDLTDEDNWYLPFE